MRFLLNGICCLRLVLLPLAVVSGCGKPENQAGEVKPDASPRPLPDAKRIETELELKALLAGIEPDERVHSRLSQYASKYGFAISGGSGSGDYFYKFGAWTVKVRVDGPSEITAITVHDGEFPAFATVADKYAFNAIFVGEACKLPPRWIEWIETLDRDEELRAVYLPVGHR